MAENLIVEEDFSNNVTPVKLGMTGRPISTVTTGCGKTVPYIEWHLLETKNTASVKEYWRNRQFRIVQWTHE